MVSDGWFGKHWYHTAFGWLLRREGVSPQDAGRDEHTRPLAWEALRSSVIVGLLIMGKRKEVNLAGTEKVRRRWEELKSKH